MQLSCTLLLAEVHDDVVDSSSYRNEKDVESETTVEIPKVVSPPNLKANLDE